MSAYGWRRRTPAEWWSDNWLIFVGVGLLVLMLVGVVMQQNDEADRRARCEAKGGVWMPGTTVWTKHVYVNTPGRCLVGVKEIAP